MIGAYQSFTLATDPLYEEGSTVVTGRTLRMLSDIASADNDWKAAESAANADNFLTGQPPD